MLGDAVAIKAAAVSIIEEACAFIEGRRPRALGASAGIAIVEARERMTS